MASSPHRGGQFHRCRRLVRRKPAQGVESRLDKSTDLGSGNGVVADMRRDDLGSESEKLASIDALVFGHLRSLRTAAATAGAVEQ